MANTNIADMSGLFGGGGSGSNAPLSFTGIPNYGSNQYTSYPMNTPGIVPSPMGLPGSSPSNAYTGTPGVPTNVAAGGTFGTGGDIPGTNTLHMAPTTDPSFTQQFYNMLTQQLGQGVTPFNLSAVLPSTGQATQAGQLSAPLDPIMQMLQSFYSGGSSNMPGASQLSQMAQTGMPTDVTPAWQSMVAAQQQNIAQSQANLKEQFAFGGDLQSSSFGNAMQNYMQGTTATQNALLGQMQQQASEAAAGRMLTAGQGIQSGAQSLGSTIQGLDQNSINALYQEFIRTQPQYNPLMQMMGQSALNTQPIAGQTNSASQTFSNIAGGIASILGL